MGLQVLCFIDLDFLFPDLTVAEMKTLWEAEKQRIVQDMKVAHAKELEKSIIETKKKQWVRNTADRSYSVRLLVFDAFTVSRIFNVLSMHILCNYQSWNLEICTQDRAIPLDAFSGLQFNLSHFVEI